MKYIVASLLTLVSLSANAQHHHHGHRHGHHHGGWHWVAPALIAGAVVYGVTRPVPPPPVIYVPAGFPPPPLGYYYTQILDANCNCYRWVLIQG